jgi:hypothetical protein
MAARAGVSHPERHERTPNMRALWRLAIWGASATAALVLAVAASYSDTGSRRLMVAMNPGVAPNSTVVVATRPAEADAETRRLTEAVRALTADRERLVARIGTLERNLEDMTGSIRRQAANPAAGTSPPSAAAPAAPNEPAAPAAAAPAAADPPATPPVAAATPAPAERVATAPAAPSEDVPEPPKHEFGVDVGGAVNLDGLRVLWTSTKGNNAALFEGLHPVVAVRENSRTKNKDLRLIAGPLASLEAATRLCTVLSASRRYCQPVGFEGQRLADADAIPERKPAAAPRPAPKPAPAPKFRLFGQ